MTEQNKELARKNVVSALIHAAIAVGFLILFFVVQSHRS